MGFIPGGSRGVPGHLNPYNKPRTSLLEQVSLEDLGKEAAKKFSFGLRANARFFILKYE